MTRDRNIISEKDAREGTKRALDALSENPLVQDLERALAGGDAQEIARAQSAFKECTKDLPPLDPLLVEFVKALARDAARRDNRFSAQSRLEFKTGQKQQEGEDE
ncbi:hypothetical protein ILT44_23925 [Microvirga sp. BT689]|uniref:hypothetical protein n=1 Tax=Microvirga arvi TaxID=2778731 RepID=UPI00194FDFD5|nr:hypothetical protein [Microvirga arvi]MBM6583255.1 hypothetical protein [Microvirga arvi]